MGGHLGTLIWAATYFVTWMLPFMWFMLRLTLFGLAWIASRPPNGGVGEA
jgi:hypothetical protein